MNAEQVHEQKLNQMSAGSVKQRECVESRRSLFNRAKTLFFSVRNVRWAGHEPDEASDKEVLQLILDFIAHDHKYHRIENDDLRRRTLYNISQSVNYLSKKFRDYGKDTDREAYWRNWQYIQKFFRTEDNFGVDGVHSGVVENFYKGIRSKDLSKFKEVVQESLKKVLADKWNLANVAFGLANQKDKSLQEACSGSQAEISKHKRNLVKMQQDSKASDTQRLALAPKIKSVTHLLAINENAFRRLQEQKNTSELELTFAKKEYDNLTRQLLGLNNSKVVENVYLIATFLRDIDSVEKMIEACKCAEKIALDSQGRILSLSEKYAVLRVLEIFGEYGSKKNLSDGVKALDQKGIINWSLLVTIRNKLQHNEYKIEESKAALDRQLEVFDLKTMISNEIPEIKKMLVKFWKRLNQIAGQTESNQKSNLQEIYLSSSLVLNQDESVLRPFSNREISDVVSSAATQYGLSLDDKKSVRELFKFENIGPEKLEALKIRCPSGFSGKSWDLLELELAQRRHGTAGLHMAVFSEPLLLAPDQSAQNSDAWKNKKRPMVVISAILDVINELKKIVALIPQGLDLVQRIGVRESAILSTFSYSAERNAVPGYTAAKKYLQSNDANLSQVSFQSNFVKTGEKVFKNSQGGQVRFVYQQHNQQAVDIIIAPCENSLALDDEQKKRHVSGYVNRVSNQEVALEVINYAKALLIAFRLRDSPAIMAALEYLMGKIYPLMKLLNEGELNALLSHQRQEELRAQRNFGAHGEMFIELDGPAPEQFILRYLHFYFVTVEPKLKAEMAKFDKFSLVLQSEGAVGILSAPTGSLRCP